MEQGMVITSFQNESLFIFDKQNYERLFTRKITCFHGTTARSQ